MQDQRYLARPFAQSTDRKVLKNTLKHTIPLLTFKLGASIAHCFSKQYFSSETLAFLGWDCTPDFVQNQMLFELAQGVNLFTHHAYYYTVSEAGKRDCPPSWSYQQPMFDVLGRMNRVWTRLARLLRRGKYGADTLLIYPISLLSLPRLNDISQKIITNDSDSPVNQAETALASLVLELCRRHISFDILDEVILNQQASVLRDGAIRIGSMKYHTVVRPDVLPLTDTLETLLAKLKHQGGRIISATDAPNLIAPDLLFNGKDSEEILVVKCQMKKYQEYLLLNLSGKDLHPDIQLPKENAETVLYDPLAGKRIMVKPNALKHLLLRKGAALMLMSPNFTATTLDFASSQYAEYGSSIHIHPCSIEFGEDNLRRIIPIDGKAVVTLEKGASVTAILAESQSLSKIHINGKPLAKPSKSSVYDCNIFDVSCKGLFKNGDNAIVVHSEEPIYLKGRFCADAENHVLLQPQKVSKHGNLAAMGYPNYCGKITYTYRFKGKYAQLEVDSANSSRVRINGRDAGVIFGNPHFLYIGELCNMGDNLLEIELYNQFGNLIAETAPYGINAVTLHV